MNKLIDIIVKAYRNFNFSHYYHLSKKLYHKVIFLYLIYYWVFQSMTKYDIVSIGINIKEEDDMQTCSVNTFQIKIPDEINREIKSDAAQTGLTKHDWILKAIRERLNREKAV